jgi:hypothetical protein
MKKIITVISFAFIALIFTTAAANAQAVQKYKAEIPFAFSLGNHSYEPGTYSVKITRLDSLGGLLTLADRNGRTLQRVVVAQTGETSRDSVLEFIRTGNQRSLSRITTADHGFRLNRSSKKRRTVAENAASVPVTASVD